MLARAHQRSFMFAIRLLLAALFSGSSPAIAASYYVDINNASASDSNPGTQQLPWKTILKAAATMVAGDTTTVNAGVYSSPVSSQRGGSAGSRITFRASGVVTTPTFTINHDYVTVDGFETSGIEVTSGNYCEVLNNKIMNGAINFSYQYSPTGCLIRGNRLYGAKSPSGDFPQIQIFGSNHLVESNEIGPSSDIDAFRIFGTGHVIRSNYVHDITYSAGSAAHMDMFQTFGDNGWISNNIVIENNRFINSDGQLFNTSQDNVSGIHDYVVRNNVFANIKQNANVGLPNFYFYNNTLYNTGIIYLVTGGPGKPFNATNTVVKNNIFVGVAGCSNTDYDNVYNNPSGLQLTKSNNFYSSCSGGALVRYASETGGINGGTPGFTNAATNDFSLQSSSSAIDRGVTLPGFDYDIRGVSRSATAPWDIGAYEFSANTPTPSPPTDILIH